MSPSWLKVIRSEGGEESKLIIRQYDVRATSLFISYMLGCFSPSTTSGPKHKFMHITRPAPHTVLAARKEEKEAVLEGERKLV